MARPFWRDNWRSATYFYRFTIWTWRLVLVMRKFPVVQFQWAVSDVLAWHIQTSCLSPRTGAVRKKKALSLGGSACGSASTALGPESADQNFWHAINSPNHPMLLAPPVHCMDNDAWQNKIWPDSQMSHTAQIPVQKWAETLQCMPGSVLQSLVPCCTVRARKKTC